MQTDLILQHTGELGFGLSKFLLQGHLYFVGILGNNESMVTGKVRKGMGKSKYPRKHGQTKDAHADMYMLHDIWIYAGNIYSYQRKFSGKLPIYELLGSLTGIVVLAVVVVAVVVVAVVVVAVVVVAVVVVAVVVLVVVVLVVVVLVVVVLEVVIVVVVVAVVVLVV